MDFTPEEEPTRQFIQAHVLDADSEWWPFVFLRPEQHQHFTAWRCALLAVLYGAPTALSGLVVGRLVGDNMQTLHLLVFPVCVSAALFAAFRIGVAPVWNRRAARLRPLHERRTQWQRSNRE